MLTRYSATLVAAALASASITGCTTTPLAQARIVSTETEEAALRSRVMTLLASYESKDVNAVLALLDPVKFTVWGSDLSEVVHTREEMRALMEADFRLWGAARFTDVRDFDWRSDGALATANFVMSFSAGGGEPIPVRLTTTWRKVDGQWLLTQAASSVPTRRGA